MDDGILVSDHDGQVDKPGLAVITDLEIRIGISNQIPGFRVMSSVANLTLDRIPLETAGPVVEPAVDRDAGKRPGDSRR